MAGRSLSCDEFKYAIICALHIEFDAVYLALDEEYDAVLGHHAQDRNSYTAGRIGTSNVVVALAEKGNSTAAGVASDMRLTFKNLVFFLVTGICGGVPTAGPNGEMVLGDIVISDNILQPDFGRWNEDGRIEMYTETNLVIGRLNQENRLFIQHIKKANITERLEANVAQSLQLIQQRIALKPRPTNKYQYPGVDTDKLYAAEYTHRHRDGPRDRHRDRHNCGCYSQSGACEDSKRMSCRELRCDARFLVRRTRLRDIQRLEYSADRSQEAQERSIIVGPVGSANFVVRSARLRDGLASQGIIAVEMEGAGTAHDAQAIIVKGVCDYADSHKNKEWQGFAAIQAAAAARELIILYEGRRQSGQDESGGASGPALSRPLDVPEASFNGRMTGTQNAANELHSRLEHARRLYASGDLAGAFKAYHAFKEACPKAPPANIAEPHLELFEAHDRMALCLLNRPDCGSSRLSSGGGPDQEMQSFKQARGLSLLSEDYAGDRALLEHRALVTQLSIRIRIAEKESPREELAPIRRSGFYEEATMIQEDLEALRGMPGIEELITAVNNLRVYKLAGNKSSR